MNLEEIKTAIAALSPEERRQLALFLGALNVTDAKNPATPKTSTEEMDAWADAEAGSARFKDGR